MSTSPEPAETISACRALFLQQFGTLLQEAALLSSPAIKAIQRGVGIYFDDVVASSRRGGFRAEVNGMTASRLTLVGEDDLELKIRFDNLSARLFQETGGDLWKIHLRFVNLLKRPDLSKALNPVGPKIYTLRELVDYTAELCGSTAKIIPLSEGFSYLQAGLLRPG